MDMYGIRFTIGESLVYLNSWRCGLGIGLHVGVQHLGLRGLGFTDWIVLELWVKEFMG